MGARLSTSASVSVSVETMYTATAASSIAQAAATALTQSLTSGLRGKTFDRFVQIWLENQDYDIAAGDPNLAYLGTLGVTLTNYYAVAHPSQSSMTEDEAFPIPPPNYVAAVGGSTHGVNHDEWARISNTTETIVDLLEAAGISWSLYQEDVPYSGFEGDYENQQTGANDYVRKHNEQSLLVYRLTTRYGPLMSYDSVTQDVNRLAKSKNFTLFYEDLSKNMLPQSTFITPNMTNDGHDTSVTVAGKWSRDFLTPLLSNQNFNTDRTLIILTFDECENYHIENRVYTVLLGGAIPSSKIGTSDGTRLDHYSLMKTVEQNWNLGDLGQNDVGATAFI
ncbi:phosphoesterase family-domain-containing protein [Diplogelasinospora grovesii]|uniref:Phosphoesterase family-domain-containing protein n=1 Tax=Diplogelasinospora grovesii TaxID=303347 RepID=A0AAN6ND31_9PEZI|nr:phosphoesterase family-domain-containing protein [Diplogelasinospora grovesii]